MVSRVRFPGEPPIYIYYAGVAELADALDLGSSALGMQVQLLSPAPFKLMKLLSFVEEN